MKEEFVSIGDVFGFLFKNLTKLNSLDNKIIYIKKNEDVYGDRYYSVTTTEFLVLIDNVKYLVGHENIIEDADDWGQAEWSESWYCKIKGTNQRVDPKVIMNKIKKILTSYCNI